MPRIGGRPADQQQGTGQRAELVPPGRYVISLASFNRRQAKNAPTDYLNGKWTVHTAPIDGRQFWAMLNMDFSKNGTVVRWQMLIEAIGIEEEFEIGASSEGTAREGDRNIARLIRHQPFVALIDKTRDGQYWNNGIQQIIPQRQWTDAEVELVNDLVDKLEQQREATGNPEDYAGGYDGPQEDPAASDDDFGPEEYDGMPEGGANGPREVGYQQGAPQPSNRERTSSEGHKAQRTQQALRPPPPAAPADDDDPWDDGADPF